MNIIKGTHAVYVEIFQNDLTPDAQRLLEEALGKNGNNNLTPIVELDFEEEDFNGTEPEL